MERRFGDLHDWAHAGRLGNLVTVNSTELPDIAVAAGERVRVRLLNVANAQIFGVAPVGAETFVIAEDGDPVPPRPLAEGSAAVLGPGQRADLVVDVPALAPGAAIPLMAWTMTGEGTIARLVAREAQAAPKGLAGTPVAPLEPNVRAEPDLSAACRIELVMEGGAMSMMRGAMHGGRMMGMREMMRSGRVWSFNGVAGDMDAPLARVE